MIPLKYIYILAFSILSYLPSVAQCTVPSSSGQILVIETGRAQVADNAVKYLSGGVVLQINDYQVKADSAIVFPDTNNFEAYGNVTLVKNNKKYITGSKAFYSADVQFLNFMNNVISYYDNQPAIAKASATYNVSQ